MRRWCLRLIGQAKAFASLLNANAKLSTLGGGYFLTRQVGQAIRLALAQAEVRIRVALRRSGLLFCFFGVPFRSGHPAWDTEALAGLIRMLIFYGASRRISASPGSSRRLVFNVGVARHCISFKHRADKTGVSPSSYSAVHT